MNRIFIVLKIVLSLLVLMVLIVPTKTYGQGASIGVFKINKFTKDDLFKLADSIDIHISLISDNAIFHTKKYSSYHNTKFILFLEKDSNNIYMSDNNASLAGRTAFIDYMEISSVKLKNIYLFFYQDTLVSLECESDEDLTEALTIKYKSPQIRETKNDIQCINGLGIKVDHTETTVFLRWVLPKPYTLYHMVRDYYDDKCAQTFSSIFVLSDSKNKEKLDKTDSDILSRMKERKEKDKISKYKDL